MTILAKVSKFSQANQKSPPPSPSPSPSPSPPTLQSALEREAQAIRAQKMIDMNCHRISTYFVETVIVKNREKQTFCYRYLRR